MSSDVLDRRLTWILWASLLTALIVAVFVAPALISTRSTTAEVARGNELAACRSEFRADIDRSHGGVVVATAQMDLLISEALTALATGERDRLPDLVATAPRLQDAINKAADRVTEATDAYDAAVTRSRQDPDGFLDACRARRR